MFKLTRRAWHYMTAALTGKYKPWGASLPRSAFGMSGDLHEHLGQLISYSRSVGVKPPWSK